MGNKIGIGLLGLGTVGTGVAEILLSPENRHPLVSQVELIGIAVRDIHRERKVKIPSEILTNDPTMIVDNPSIEVVVEVMGGLEPARTLIMRAIESGKSVVTANKAVIARYGSEIASAANRNGVYVLIEAAVGGGIPIIEPIKQSLCGNKIIRISGIINGTTNYILSRMEKEGIAYDDVLKIAQELGYAEADPAADIEGLDAADKIAILSGLAFGGNINREDIPTKGINNLQSRDVNYASELGYQVKLLALAEFIDFNQNKNDSIPLAVRVQPTLIPKEHPLAAVNGVNNAILLEGDPVGEVMFYGPGAGAGPTASAVVADILNIAGINKVGDSSKQLDPLLAASSWRNCHLVQPDDIIQSNYIRLISEDSPGVIGKIGKIFGERNVSIQSIVQFDASLAGAEIVIITHQVTQGQINASLDEIKKLQEIKEVAAHMGCI